MRVFIAGATGVLGTALVPLLQERGHAVLALARSPRQVDRLRAAGAEPVEGDLLLPSSLRGLPAALDGCEAVVHAATAIPPAPGAPGAWETTGRLRTTGARALLGACLTAGVGTYVQQSIVMAYRDGGDAWLDETWPLDTTPERAAVCGPVVAMEEHIRSTPPGRLRWTILRGGSFVGPGTAQDGVVDRLRAGRVTVPGRGHAFISPIHVVDMARAVLLAVEAGLPGAVFNVVDEPLRQGAYFAGLAERVGAPSPPHDERQREPPSFRCSNAAIRSALSWRPGHSIWPAVGAGAAAFGAC